MASFPRRTLSAGLVGICAQPIRFCLNSLLLSSFGPCDVVIEALAVRHDRVEQRCALGTVLHGMRDDLDVVVHLESSARPALASHDICGAAFNIPGPNRGGIRSTG